MTDHLGNNRVVANASGTVIQRNHYYRFGMSFTDTLLAEQGKQPYKYNGKELDQMHGLNMYDYNARFYEPSIGRFSTVDPHAENYYNISPYAYVGNNPLKYIDPTGMDWYLNQSTGELYFNKSIADKTTMYNEQEYTRIGDNNMMGDMGRTAEMAYNYDDSQSMANKNNYGINPTQQVVHEKSLEQSYKTGPNNVTITTGETTVVNEKYGISPMEATEQIRDPKNKTEVLYEGKFGLKEFAQTMAGGKPKENIVRRYSTYRNETQADKNQQTILKVLNVANAIGGGVHDYTNPPTVYRSWNSYNRATGGKGVLLKYKK